MSVKSCLCCEKEINEDAAHPYHARCLRDLLLTTKLPELHFSTAEIFAQAQKMIGRMSISGVQEKLSIRINRREADIVVVAVGGTHILKPSPSRFPHLAENENFYMNLAAELEIETPPHGLFPLVDGALVYLVKRFDRDDDGNKIHMEDFAQLLCERDKYKGSIERIGNFLKKYSTIPFLDTQKLFARTLFNFLIGNGDAHLKNFSMIRHPTLGYRLSPAYDIVSSRLVMPTEKEEISLGLNGKKNNPTRGDFKKLAAYLEIEKKPYDSIMESARNLPTLFEGRISKSFLPQEMKEKAAEIFRERHGRVFG